MASKMYNGKDLEDVEKRIKAQELHDEERSVLLRVCIKYPSLSVVLTID